MSFYGNDEDDLIDCEKCDARGYDGECGWCGGSGRVTLLEAPWEKDCGRCDGSGILRGRCSWCNGSGKLPRN